MVKTFFVKLIYLISRDFLPGLFQIFCPTMHSQDKRGVVISKKFCCSLPYFYTFPDSDDIEEVTTIINSNPKTAPRPRKIFISDVKTLLSSTSNNVESASNTEDQKPSLKSIMYEASSNSGSDLDSPIHHPNLSRILKIKNETVDNNQQIHGRPENLKSPGQKTL